MPIDRKRRKRPMRVERHVDRLTDRFERRVLETALGKDRRETGCDQQHVAIAHRYRQLLGEVQHHLAARLRASGFEKTEVSRGNVGGAREIELTQSTTLTPLAQVLADRSGAMRHRATIPESLVVISQRCGYNHACL